MIIDEDVGTHKGKTLHSSGLITIIIIIITILLLLYWRERRFSGTWVCGQTILSNVRTSFYVCMVIHCNMDSDFRSRVEWTCMALSENWPTAASCGLRMVKGTVQAEAIQLQAGRMAVDGFNIVAAAVGWWQTRCCLGTCGISSWLTWD